MSIEWKGLPGHFVGCSNCCWHLNTEIDGKYRVSSVGCYHPRGEPDDDNVETIGLGRYYETMVFRLGEDGKPESWLELDMDGYQTAKEAEDGHRRMLGKWIEIARQEDA